MRRLPIVALVCWVGLLSAQTDRSAYESLPEEDEDLVPQTEYSFNPIQAAEEFKVGEFYWKRGSYEAAAGRYEEATKWDPTNAEAFFKLAESHLKLADEARKSSAVRQVRLSPATEVTVTLTPGENDEETQHLDAARTAFEKYVELEPKGGHADRARREIARLERH